MAAIDSTESRRPQLLAGRPAVADNALPGTKHSKRSAVGQHPPDVGYIRRIDQGQLLQAAHALRQLGAQQVTLTGMHAQYLAIRSDLESLRGSAM